MIGLIWGASMLFREKPLPAELQIPVSDEGVPGAGPLRRGEWFQEVWNKRRHSWIGKKTKRQQGAVVFLGDSITQGWGNRMGGAFGDLKVANRGIAGDTSRGVLFRLPEDVLALNPRGVVLLIGTNDIADGAEPEVIANNVRLIVSALQEHNADMPIIICEVFPAGPDNNRPVAKIKQLNALYAEAWADDPNVVVLKTFRLFANDEELAMPVYIPDLLHPNAAGYKRWEAAVRPVLVSLGLMKN